MRVKALCTQKNSFAPFAASVRDKKQRSQSLLQSYLEAVNQFLRRSATNQAVAEKNALIPKYATI